MFDGREAPQPVKFAAASAIHLDLNRAPASASHRHLDPGVVDLLQKPVDIAEQARLRTADLLP
jgi:hypothetical protein